MRLTLEEKLQNQSLRNKWWAAANKDSRREYMKQWRRDNPLKAVLHSLTTGARIRAKQKGMEYDDRALDVERLFKELTENMACRCCGTTMVAQVECGHSHLAVSLDRVENDKGYVAGNVFPICRGCNTRKKAMSIDQLQKIIDYIRERTL